MTADGGQAPTDRRRLGSPSSDTVSNLTLAVGRALGAVVVTVKGEIDPLGSELLEGVLTDLIEDQRNLFVAVDLGKAVVEPEALAVFINAAERARLRGAKFALKEPPPAADGALRSAGLADYVQVVADGGASQGGMGAAGRRSQRQALPTGHQDGRPEAMH